jgi:hypothetical protein
MRRKPLSPNEIEMLLQPQEENEEQVVNEIIKSINEWLITARMEKSNLKLSRKEDDRDIIMADIGITQRMFMVTTSFYPTIAQFEKAIELFEANGWKDKIIKTETEYEFCNT